MNRYRELLGDKYLRHPATGKYLQLDPPPQSQLGCFVDRDDNWVVTVDPPTGWFLQARVDRFGRWTELIRVGLTVE
ncbi:MAG TPA: hypothetical protein VJR89_03590 [Polyangiales bacterium]|nr:hypothetical protein [Polyangiales bacterium]